MRKKIIYVGLLLIFLGVVVGILSNNSSAYPSITNAVINQTQAATNSSALMLKIGHDNFSYAIMNIYSNLSVYTITANISGYANFYLFNGSAFKIWSNDISNLSNQTGAVAAQSLNDKGTIYAIENVSSARITNLYYGANATPSLHHVHTGSYYIVIDNTKGSPSYNKEITANISYAVFPFNVSSAIAQNINEQTQSLLSPIRLLSGIMIFIGIVVDAYGIFARSNTNQPANSSAPPKRGIFDTDEPTQEYIDLLYKNITKSNKPKKVLSTKTKQRKARKTKQKG